MNCPSCSQPLKPGARFCAECGATVGPPPATDKTIVASAMPIYSPSADQGSAPPAQQPYAQPQQPYAQPQQPYAQPQNQYQQPGQPQYGGQYPQAQPQYGAPAQQYAPAGYAVQTAGAVPAANGRIPAILLLLSALTFVISLFLPFLISGSDNVTVVDVLNELAKGDNTDVPGAVWIFVALPVVAVLSLLTSAMALWKRRQIWGVLDLIFGLLLFGFSGLLLIGANVSGSDYEAGSALWLMFAGGVVMFVCSIVYLARKKAPR